MRRNTSLHNLKSDSGLEDFVEIYNDDDQASSIFMADATSSGNSSDLEKESRTGSPNEFYHEEYGDEVTEGSSLLAGPQYSNTYGGITTLKDTTLNNKDSYGGHSLPSIIYASPARPHLPSPSASNSQVT